MRWSELGGERCSIARTVAIIVDRWTLLVLRDCFLRVRRFEDFEARLGITRHNLADRLKKLVRGSCEKWRITNGLSATNTGLHKRASISTRC
jgi:DNA-binding HxlR family transcriptional regulator